MANFLSFKRRFRLWVYFSGKPELTETLNKSPAAVSGSFPPTLRYRKREIHTVFHRFRCLDWPKNLPPTALADLIRASLAHTLYMPPGKMSIPRRQNRCKFRADTTLYPLERVGAVLGDEQVGDDIVADQIPLRGQHPAAGVVLGRLIVAAALFQHIF